MRSMQHKREAYWFYWFLSMFYDAYVNPFFWTARMRTRALALAKLQRTDLLTLDVGSGTGFTTQGIVQDVAASQVICLDQSPQQMAKATQKPELAPCRFALGDAEHLPFATDHFDRYISAGSIEYWPHPQRGIAEAYRVLKPGGVALIIGPLRPQHRLARLLADIWMLFPAEDAYRQWLQHAGFVAIEHRYIAPAWIVREPYGIAICGTKPGAGDSAARDRTMVAELPEPASFRRAATLLWRLLIGASAGFLFIPVALYGHGRQKMRAVFGKAKPHHDDALTPQQTLSVLAMVVVAFLIAIYLLVIA